MGAIGVLAVAVAAACSGGDEGPPRDTGEATSSASTGAAGSGGATSSTTAGSGGSATSTGSGGSGGDAYVAGLEKDGENGLYTVKLVESVPIPQDTGLYTWTIQLLDANDQPVDAAVIAAEPRMPAHNHGTFPPITDAVATAEPGTYSLDAMDLFMPGIWEVTIRVMEGENIADQAAFYFDLEG